MKEKDEEKKTVRWSPKLCLLNVCLHTPHDSFPIGIYMLAMKVFIQNLNNNFSCGWNIAKPINFWNGRQRLVEISRTCQMSLLSHCQKFFLLFIFLSSALIYDICFRGKPKLSIQYESIHLSTTSALYVSSKYAISVRMIITIVMISLLTIILILHRYQLSLKQTKWTSFNWKYSELKRQETKAWAF